jgi:hypothetical protein
LSSAWNRFLERRLPDRTKAVLDAYGRIGGGILADGLAYNALFALLPAVLLVVAVVGFVVHDPARQAQIVDAIAADLPPLNDLLSRTLQAMAAGATEVSIVGLVTLTWGASRFARALDASFGRVFNRTPRRGIVRRSLVGVASVVVLIVAVVVALGLAWSGGPARPADQLWRDPHRRQKRAVADSDRPQLTHDWIPPWTAVWPGIPTTSWAEAVHRPVSRVPGATSPDAQNAGMLRSTPGRSGAGHCGASPGDRAGPTTA